MDEGIVNVSRMYLEFAVRLITIERQIQLVRSKGRTRDADAPWGIRIPDQG